MTIKSFYCGLLAALAVAGSACAQQPGPPPGFYIKSIAPPPAPGAVALYPGLAPGSETAPQVEQWNDIMGQKAVRNVTRPTLTPYLPKPGAATGAAVIVAPGGAYLMLSMDNEGEPVARWLADHGVAAFVLKYRTDPTPADDKGFMDALGERFGAAARASADKRPAITQPLAVADAQQALRVVRAQAESWGVDPRRVGLLGFSAGAMTALEVTLKDDPSARPDFVGSIYGPMTAVVPPAKGPPLFVALAADDGIFGGLGAGVVEAWSAAKLPVEFHLYEKGGHGFGMLGPRDTSQHWIDEFYWWMQARGLLQSSAGPAPKAP